MIKTVAKLCGYRLGLLAYFQVSLEISGTHLGGINPSDGRNFSHLIQRPTEQSE